MHVTSSPSPVGRLLTAMVTPFTSSGTLDLEGAARLAAHLVDDLGHDGLVLNGTTGEAPTTSDAEKEALLRAVVATVGDRAHIVAGVGTYDTAHSVHLARAAHAAGADALLAVTPYYSRPPQAGLVAHFTAIADATDLPVITYDIPRRTGTGIDADTFARLAEHPRIVANKDARSDLEFAENVIADTGLAWYSGDDALNLPLLAVGACGFISVVGHLVGDRLADLLRTFEAGDVAAARRINAALLPVYTGCFRAQGVVLTKAALNHLGLPAGPVRAPLMDATEQEVAVLLADLSAGAVRGFA